MQAVKNFKKYLRSKVHSLAVVRVEVVVVVAVVGVLVVAVRVLWWWC